MGLCYQVHLDSWSGKRFHSSAQIHYHVDLNGCLFSLQYQHTATFRSKTIAHKAVSEADIYIRSTLTTEPEQYISTGHRQENVTLQKVPFLQLLNS